MTRKAKNGAAPCRVIEAGEHISVWRYANPVRMFADLWKRRDLIRQLTKQETVNRYRGTCLGMAWALVLPLFMLLIYTFVFGVVFKMKWPSMVRADSKVEFALTLYCGLILYNIFNEAILGSVGSISGNPNYVKKVVFPLEVLPVAKLGGALIHGSLSLVIFMTGNTIFITRPTWTVLLYPLVIASFCAFIIGLSWFLSAIGAFVRDAAQVVMVIVQVLLFISPIFYSVTIVPEKLRWVMYLNPLTTFIIDARRTLMWSLPNDWFCWGMVTVVSLITMQGGYMFFMRSKRAFGDVI